jgi:hypothetical protein
MRAFLVAVSMKFWGFGKSLDKEREAVPNLFACLSVCFYWRGIGIYRGGFSVHDPSPDVLTKEFVGLRKRTGAVITLDPSKAKNEVDCQASQRCPLDHLPLVSGDIGYDCVKVNHAINSKIADPGLVIPIEKPWIMQNFHVKRFDCLPVL